MLPGTQDSVPCRPQQNGQGIDLPAGYVLPSPPVSGIKTTKDSTDDRRKLRSQVTGVSVR